MIPSPGELLDPRHEVVPFHGRDRELADLARWRDASVLRSVLLLHGPAGVGKTRLARRFADDTVLVVDDADLLPWHEVQAVLRGGPTRVLLISRGTGWWWSATRQRAGDLHYEVADLPTRPCPDLHDSSFADACAHFADALGLPRPDVPAPHAETFHDLHLAALGAVHGDSADNPVDLIRRLVGADPPTTGRLAEDALAVALLDDRIEPAPDALDTLLRAAERWPHVLHRAEELFTADPGLVAKASPGPLRVLAGLPVAKAVARHVFDDPRFHGDVLPALLTRTLLRDAGTTLDRARLNGLLSARAALAALREEAVDASAEEVALCRRLADDDPGHRPALAEALGDLGLRLVAAKRHDEAVAAAEEAVALCRADRGRVPQLAAALDRLGLRYAAVCRRDEAVSAIGESSALFDELARHDPELFRLPSAKAAHHLAARLFEVGRRAEAGHAVRRAVLQWRAVADADPRYEAEFARTLASVATLLSTYGRPTEAAAVVRESIGVLRRLAEANPRDFEPELASALGNLGALLRRLDRRSEAAQAFRDCVEVWRGVPGATARLAEAWHLLADSAVANEDARAAARMAVLLWHVIGAHDADTAQRYAETLALYARRCAEAGTDLDRALAAAHKAVALLRAAQAEPDRLARAENAVEEVVRAHPARTRDLPSSS